MDTTPHVLVFPYPALSHINSLLELSYRFLDRGFKITFLNTEFNHRRLLAALPDDQAAAAASSMKISGGIRLAAIPDGLGPTEDRNDLGRLMVGVMAAMPGHLEEFMARGAAETGEERFTWFLTDLSMGWSVDIAGRVGLRSLAFFPMAAALLAGSLNIPKLIQDGVVDREGIIMWRHQHIKDRGHV